MKKLTIVKEEKNPYFAEMEYTFRIEPKEEVQVVELAKAFIEDQSGKDGYWIENVHEENENTFLYYEKNHDWVGFFRRKKVGNEEDKPIYAARVAI